jgi:hypothetical protein
LKVEAEAQLNSIFEKFQCLKTWNYKRREYGTIPRILAVHLLNGSTDREKK